LYTKSKISATALYKSGGISRLISTILKMARATTGFSITGTVNNIPIYQKEALIMQGDYMFIITVTCIAEDYTDAVFAFFYKL